MAEPIEINSLRARFNELRNQEAVAEQTIRDSDEIIPTLKLELEQRKKSFEILEKRCFRGELTSDSIAPEEAEVKKLEQNLEEARKALRLASKVLPDIRSEYVEIGRKISSALFKFCQGEKKNLTEEIPNREKTRAKILSAYAAMANGGGYSTNWGAFLGEIFPPPNQEETKAAVREFREKHGLDKS